MPTFSVSPAFARTHDLRSNHVFDPRLTQELVYSVDFRCKRVGTMLFCSDALIAMQSVGPQATGIVYLFGHAARVCRDGIF